MIVKNEAHIIQRALASALPYISYWVVCDTGSDDGTPDVVREVLQTVPGELHHTPWVNFGHNRTVAIRHAIGKADYVLIMDADMVVNVYAEFRHRLGRDYYEIRYTGENDYSQAMLVSSRLDWYYVGVTHEYIHADNKDTWDFLPELSLTHLGDGGNRSDKFERDIALLTAALVDEPDNVRYHFYLAQSYHHLARYAEALTWYERRIAGEGWEEERWYAMLQLAEMKRMLEHPWPEVLAAYLRALDARPQRYEPLYAIASHYRAAGDFIQGYMYSAIAGQGLAYPQRDLLFIDRPVYAYLLALEHALCAAALGRVSEAIRAANSILKQPNLPPIVQQHALHARSFSLQLLYGQGRQLAPGAALPRIVVVVPFHNPGAYLDTCALSLVLQDATNFRVIFIDDGSTDSAADFTPPAALNATLIRHARRMGAAYNYHLAITGHCQPDDIVVCLDGDDWLACTEALGYIQSYYASHDCWVMYGQYQEVGGALGVSMPFASPDDFRTLRDEWRTSHIRTFRAGLYQCIADQDPHYDCLKDRDGQWLTASTDAAKMLPMLEMAGFNRVHYNEKVLYIYNNANPLSHHHVDRDRQRAAFFTVCEKRPFSRVHSYVPQGISIHV